MLHAATDSAPRADTTNGPNARFRKPQLTRPSNSANRMPNQNWHVWTGLLATTRLVISLSSCQPRGGSPPG